MANNTPDDGSAYKDILPPDFAFALMGALGVGTSMWIGAVVLVTQWWS